MSDQPEQNEVDKTIRTKEGSQGTTQALKDLASVILSKTNTYTPEEVNYLAHSQEFGKKVDKVKNIAHKSGGGEAPEGTILAMEKALENGADWLDIDLRITKGKSDSEIGTIIISHSPRAEDIDPSSDVKGTIPELTLEQIKKLDAGHNFTKDYKNFPYRGEGLDIPTVSLAKREEKLYLPIKPNPILLSTMPNEVENLLKHVRDEAHRFAIIHHRSRHRKTFI